MIYDVYGTTNSTKHIIRSSVQYCNVLSSQLNY